MSDVIVLAMHGAPPNDFPRAELSDYFRLHSAMEMQHSSHAQSQAQGYKEMGARYAELDSKMKSWPRTAANDPFYAGAMKLGKLLEQESGLRVIVGFNEFCAPDLAAAFEQAAALKPARVVVLTPMMTAGGDHSERDIPRAIDLARKSHPDIAFTYAWPFDQAEVALFLVNQMQRSIAAEGSKN